jgi:hypothetical protein
MKATSLKVKGDSLPEASEMITLEPIRDDDPFFAAAPVDLGHTNNDIIDELLYGCRK